MPRSNRFSYFHLAKRLINGLLFFIFISIPGNVLAQDVYGDSLRNEWLDVNNSKLKRLKALAAYVDNENSDLRDSTNFMSLTDTFYQVATKWNSKKFQTEAINDRGNWHANHKNYKISDSLYKTALEIFKSIKDTTSIARMYFNLSQIGQTIPRQRDSARANLYADSLKQVVRIRPTLGNRAILYHHHVIRGFHYRNWGRITAYTDSLLSLDLAMPGGRNLFFKNLVIAAVAYSQIQEYGKSMLIFDLIDHRFKQLNLEDRLLYLGGAVYTLELAQQYDLGAVYAKRMATILVDPGGDEIDDERLLVYYNVIAQTLTRSGDYDPAVLYAGKASELAFGVKNNWLYHMSRTTLGESLHFQGKTDSAYSILMESKVFFDSMTRKGTNPNIQLDVSLGELYLHREQFKLAVEQCERAFWPNARHDLYLTIRACNCLYTAYRKLGNKDSSIHYLEMATHLKDSLKSDEQLRQFQMREFRETRLRDSLNNVSKAQITEEEHQQELLQKKNARNLALAGGIVLLLVAGGLYNRNRFIKRSRDVIRKEKDRSENLLLNILPAEIAEELKANGEAAARDFERVSILFTDFQAFTKLSEQIGAKELVAEMNYCFKAFDAICEKYKVEKIKTIGDSYMAAGGLPIPNKDSVKNTVLAGIEMAQFIVDRKVEREASGAIPFEMRTGIHTGNVVAGIIGIKKFQYDVWGDTVNTASRMESNGAVGQVNISQATYDLIKQEPDFEFEPRGKIEAKGKGAVEMYFVSVNSAE